MARCLIGYQTIDIFHSIHFLKYLYHTLTFIPEITCAQDIVQFIIFQIIYAQYQAFSFLSIYLCRFPIFHNTILRILHILRIILQYL